MYQIREGLSHIKKKNPLTLRMWHPFSPLSEQVQEELDRVLDPAQPICYEDRKILPFTNAVLHETQRYSSISAIGIVHKCTQDTTLQGWPISKVRSCIHRSAAQQRRGQTCVIRASFLWAQHPFALGTLDAVPD